MSEEEFLKIIEEIDGKLSRRGTPIFQRPLMAHCEISRITGDRGPLTEITGVEYPPYVGPNLSKSISEWYSKRWGERSFLPTTIGKIPILLRGEIFISRIPLVYGDNVQIPILKTIDDITDDFVNSLTEDEKKVITKTFQDGYNLIYEVDHLRGYLKQKDLPSKDDDVYMLIQNAIEDCNKAVQCLSENLDTNGSRFHSQQFSEKMLKGYLMIIGGFSLQQVEELQHRLNDILKECIRIDSSFVNLEANLHSLKTIQPDIRYTDPKSSPIDAYNDFWDSLRIAGVCACNISRSGRRFGT